jgi:CRISPR-associated protein Cmr3
MPEHLFIEPLDVLYLRGNKLFGDAGSHGEALMPPWPSVAAGAIRSRMLTEHSVNLEAFRHGGKPTDDQLAKILGTPSEPGAFRLSLFTLARRVEGQIEPLFPAPADLVCGDDGMLPFIRPSPKPKCLRCSSPTPRLPILAQDKQGKAKSGLWLTAAGMAAYLAGKLPDSSQVLSSTALWAFDPRLGIALDAGKRAAESGKIYTAETVALHRQVGFLAAIKGADGYLPADGVIRLGGDGRGAAVSRCHPTFPKTDFSPIETTGQFRLILASPGLFEGGWRLPGLDADGLWQGPDGCTAKLAAASVPRSQVISGWDLAKKGSGYPKPALRAAPVGSVYWFEEFKGSMKALHKLVSDGFWSISGYPDRQRQAEGFNNVMLAVNPEEA